LSCSQAYKAKEDRFKLYKWFGVNNLLSHHQIGMSKSLIGKKKTWTKIVQLKIGGQNCGFISIGGPELHLRKLHQYFNINSPINI
jgi:hypothetical protein